MKRISRKRKPSITTVIVLIAAVISLFPLYWMIVGSLKNMKNMYDVANNILPTDMTVENYAKLFSTANVSRWLLNSFTIAAVGTAAVILTNTMAGYALAKKRFCGRQLFFWLVMATLMLPRQVLIVPMYIHMSNLNLLNTVLGLCLPTIGWPIGIFLIRQFMMSLPDAVLESARIDGAGEFRIFFGIVVPLAKPGIASLAIFTFMNIWNDYLWQSIAISKSEMVTMPLGVAQMQQFKVIDYGMMFAGATMAALPMLTVFLVFQKYFTKGLTAGSIKG